MRSLEQAIRESWSRDTTSIPDEWDSITHSERGQCVPTALVVQDYLGGKLIRLATTYRGQRETHYRNITDDELTIDLTRAQYPDDQQFELAPVQGNVREYVLASDTTRHRYHLLAEAVDALMRYDE